MCCLCVKLLTMEAKENDSNDMTRANIYVSKSLLKKVDQEAKEQYRSRSKEVGKLLEEALELRAFRKQQKGLPFDE